MGKKYQVEGYWDCSACHTKGIRGSKRECPNCGKPRGEDVQFYLKEFDESHAVSKEEESTAPDWLCEYCSSYNPDSAQRCLSCGADRSGKTYADTHDTHTSSRIHDEDGNGIEDSSQLSEKERDQRIYDLERQERERHSHKQPTASLEPCPSEDTPFWKTPKEIAEFTAVVMFLAALIYFVIPQSIDLEVEQVAWERNISIQTKTTVKESDWSVPVGGRVYEQHQEFHHNEQVLDHYETYYEDVSEQVIDRYRTVTYKRDLGNGKFEIEKTQEPVYRTVTHKEKRERPVYRDEPVYKTKYYFEIERWKSTRNVPTSGSDHNAYWGEYTLAKGKPPYGAGEEKVGRQTQKYTVKGKVKGEDKEYQVEDFAWWETMNVGDIIHAKATYDGKLKKEEK